MRLRIGHVEIALALLEAHAYPKRTNIKGDTPLKLAQKRRHTERDIEMIKLLKRALNKK